ncbi:MAG: hypothetical protein LQ348_007704 [Seirophora lacunosa]|nr:MAG: hypothetical protein LQ348_007704 [Seirophora lacunosa]
MANAHPNNAHPNDNRLEKDFSNHGINGKSDANTSDDALTRLRTAGSVNISPELFEKLYLSPESRVKGVFFFFGGLLMILGAIGEWIIGNTFPFVVFGTFGAFWLAFGATLVPWFNAYGAYVTDPVAAAANMGNPGNPAGLEIPAFNSSFAFFLIFMGLICLVFLLCSLRTNVVFVTIFFTLVCAFGCLAGAYFNLALYHQNEANLAAATTAARCLVVSSPFFPFSPHLYTKSSLPLPPQFL